MSDATAFARSIDGLATALAADTADAAIDPRCLPAVHHHGGPANDVAVLFHGFTNCPRQFAAFAQLLFERGYNVYVPRLPRHGLRDKRTPELAGLTIDELTACAAQSVRFATGLGARTRILGLSLGASLAAWLAQTEVLDRVVAVAPFFSITHVPSLAEPAVAGALELAPNLELWWDPRRRDDVGPAHGYPRFSTHALARCLDLGREVRDLARAAAPLTARATLVINALDPAIDNAAARDVWQLWRDHGAPVDEFEFTDLDARHDIIEPTTYADAARLVYPVLLRLLER